jgi:hypothetical protein
MCDGERYVYWANRRMTCTDKSIKIESHVTKQCNMYTIRNRRARFYRRCLNVLDAFTRGTCAKIVSSRAQECPLACRYCVTLSSALYGVTARFHPRTTMGKYQPAFFIAVQNIDTFLRKKSYTLFTLLFFFRRLFKIKQVSRLSFHTSTSLKVKTSSRPMRFAGSLSVEIIVDAKIEKEREREGRKLASSRLWVSSEPYIFFSAAY